MLKRRAESKESIGQKWERLRLELRAKGQTFEQQLAVEQLGELTALRSLVRRFYLLNASFGVAYERQATFFSPHMYRFLPKIPDRLLTAKRQSSPGTCLRLAS